MAFQPNTTPTPNWLYNGEMKKMNETQLKVVLLVTRKTLGWFNPKTNERKEQDYISQSQFMEFTGKGNKAISLAIQSCVEKGWIIARDKNGDICDTPEKRSRRKVWYQLGDIFTSKVSGVESTLDEKEGESGVHNDSNLVYISHSSGVQSTQYKRNRTKETNKITRKNSRKGITKEKVTDDGVIRETSPSVTDMSFSLKAEVKKLKQSDKRWRRLVGYFLEERKPSLRNRHQFELALKRHKRAAEALSHFDPDQIAQAKDTANEEYPDKWTLETLEKILTK